ncbi:MAG: hypothetical protein RIE58_11390 [Vicingaceae bacterium]
MNFDSKIVEELYHEEEHQQQKLIREARNLLTNVKKVKAVSQYLIISEKAIKIICLRYRLRFLDLSYFKGDIPIEASEALVEARKAYGQAIKSIKIIAPGELFKLENREKDPMLLADLGEGKYLLIYKWGAEFSTMRQFYVLPMRNIPSMIVSLGIIALLFSVLLIPFAGGVNLQLKEFIFGFGVVWLGCISYCLFLALSQNIMPTSLIWNSKFLD